MSDDFEDLSTDLEEEMDEQPNSKTPMDKTPSGKGKKISVFFSSTIGPSSKREKMVISTDAPVSDIKYTVSQVFALDPNDFHLSYAGRTMDPDDIVENYDVEDGDEVLLIPVSTAGRS